MPTIAPLTSPRDQATFQRCLAFALNEHARNGAAFEDHWSKTLPPHYLPRTMWPDFDPWPGEDGQAFSISLPSVDAPRKYNHDCNFEGLNVLSWLFAGDLEEFDLLAALQRQGRAVDDWNKVAEEGQGRDYIQTLLECLRRGYLTLRDLELYGTPVLPDGFEMLGVVTLRVEAYDLDALRICQRRGRLVSDDVTEVFKSYQCQHIKICDRFRAAARFADEHGEHGGYRIEYLDGEAVKVLDIADAELRSEGSGLWKRLAREGFTVEGNRQAQDAFRKLLNEWPGLSKRPSIIRFSRSGFHLDNLVYISPNGDVVVDDSCVATRLFDLALEAKIPGGESRLITVAFPDEPAHVGQTLSENVERHGDQPSSCQSTRQSPTSVLGVSDDLRSFKVGVLDPIFNEPDFRAMAYSVLQSCSGIVTALGNIEGLGVLWWSHARDGAPSSSTGKSTAQRLGASVAGSHEENEGLFVKADLTREQLKNKLHRLSGAAVHLDESATAKLKVEEIAYTAGGSATTTPFSLSSEKRIDELGRDIRTGASVRLATLDLSKLRPKAVNRLRVDRIKRDALRYGRHGDALLRAAAEAMAQGWHLDSDRVARAVEERALGLLAAVGVDPDHADGAVRLRTATAFAAASLAGNLLASAGLIEASAADAAVGWAWRNHIDYLREFGGGADAPPEIEDPDVAAFVKWLRTSTDIVEIGDLDGPGVIGWRDGGSHFIKMKPLDTKRLSAMGVRCDRRLLLHKLEQAQIFRPNPKKGSGRSAGYERVPQTGRRKSIWHYRFTIAPAM